MTMPKLLIATALFLAPTPLAAQAASMLVRESASSLADVRQRAITSLESKGLNVFSEIDHADNADLAGMELEPTLLILFGNPRVGTVLMQCSRSAGLDLPLKILLWRQGDRTFLAYDDPTELLQKHSLGPRCERVVQRVSDTLSAIATDAVTEPGPR